MLVFFVLWVGVYWLCNHKRASGWAMLKNFHESQLGWVPTFGFNHGFVVVLFLLLLIVLAASSAFTGWFVNHSRQISESDVDANDFFEATGEKSFIVGSLFVLALMIVMVVMGKLGALGLKRWFPAQHAAKPSAKASTMGLAKASTPKSGTTGSAQPKPPPPPATNGKASRKTTTTMPTTGGSKPGPSGQAFLQLQDQDPCRGVDALPQTVAVNSGIDSLYIVAPFAAGALLFFAYKKVRGVRKNKMGKQIDSLV